MTYPYNKIELVVSRMKLEDNIDKASIQSLCDASILGWDITNDRSLPDPVNFLMYRTPHLLTCSSLSEIDPSRPPVVHAEMSKEELYNAIFRLTRISPESQYTYNNDDLVKVDPGDFYSTVKFQNSVDRPLADRDWLIFSVFGHTFRDAIDFLHDALNKKPEIGRMLLSKRYKEALAKQPDLPNWKWPKKTQLRWRITGGKDYMAPFDFLTLLAEFQRLAQNVTALISLSFRKDGSPLTIASAVNDLAAVDPSYVGPSYSIFDSCIAGLTTPIPLQTYALVPNNSTIRNYGAMGGIQHTEKAFCILKDAISNGPEDTLERLSGLSNQSLSAFMSQTMIAHPDHKPDRKIKGNKLAIRTEYHAKYYGLNWTELAYFGLFQLISAAKAFNEKYNKTPFPKRIPQNQSNIVNVRQAVARISNAWLETAHPAAYDKKCKEIAVVQATNERVESSAKDYGRYKQYSPDNGGTIKKSARKNLIKNVEPMPSIVDFDVKIQVRQLSKIEQLVAKKRAKGMPGYTAEYYPTLWYMTHEELDDIGFWIGRRIAAQKGKIANLQLTPPLIAQKILSDIDLYRHTPSTIEDRAAQNLAMTVGEFSLDPMHSFFRRRGIKLSYSPRFNSFRKKPGFNRFRKKPRFNRLIKKSGFNRFRKKP